MDGASVLRGELGLLSLFDLGQLLMLNRASGELSVTRDGNRGYFYFDGGTIVNAVDDEYHEGPGAAYKLFTWRTGNFEFTPGPGAGARSIEENTEALMMEAARRMDEAGADGGGQADKLVARANSLEALREAFLSVASEATDREALGVDGDASAFDLLRDPADALLLRPGAPQRVRSNGRWRALGSQLLDAQAYEALRARLLEGAPDASREGSPRAHRVTLAGNRRFEVTHLAGGYEALWVRAAALVPPGTSRLDGDMATLDAMLARTAGLLLVAAPDAGTAESLFHTCVARISETRGGTLLLAADHERWRHPDRAGAVMPATGADAEALARTIAPDVAAFDLDHAAQAASVLATVPRVVAAVVSPDAEGAPARWCTLAGRRWGDGIKTLLTGGALEVVAATRAAAADGRIAFKCVRLALVAASNAAATTRTEAPETATPGAPAAPGEAPAPVSADAPAEAPAGPPAPSRPLDGMAALAAELKRTLRKAA